MQSNRWAVGLEYWVLGTGYWVLGTATADGIRTNSFPTRRETFLASVGEAT